MANEAAAAIDPAEAAKAEASVMPESTHISNAKCSEQQADQMAASAEFACKANDVPVVGGLFYRFVKRAFDIVFSLVVIVILFIPGLILAIVISVESSGGPLFRQKRVGKDGKEIEVWKFRSMYADAHEYPGHYLNEAQLAQWKREQKVADDPRITKVGAFIRRTSLDEVPQFLNVLKSDLSVIGPRPVTMAETYEFGRYRDEFLSVRPGITGWWQTTKRNDATWENGKRQALELEYVRHRGFAMDIACFIGTFKAMFGKDRTGR
jgi:lipopolysaccharide/colanic/teichoic acid biosynthesis glycosyltransferase